MVEESDRHSNIAAALAADFPDLPNSGVYHSVIAAVVRMAQAAEAGRISEAELATIAPAQANVPPMPTHEELERDGKLYSQRFAAAEKAGRKYNIIDHLKDVWMPWIETGELTRPILYQRSGSAYGDRSAYHALANWLKKDGNDLKEALGGFDIPNRSVVARSGITEEQRREARRIVALDKKEQERARSRRRRDEAETAR